MLCLAGSRGLQALILAAAGANVTVFDNSPAQLAQDQRVANREGLKINLVQGDMADLSAFETDSFDLTVHSCSNCFAPDVLRVSKKAARVMKRGANLVSGMINPIVYLFDDQVMEKGESRVCHKILFPDLTCLTLKQRPAYLEDEDLFCFGHALQAQIGGQIDAGLAITGMLDDCWLDWPISEYIATFLVTKATKINRIPILWILLRLRNRFEIAFAKCRAQLHG